MDLLLFLPFSILLFTTLTNGQTPGNTTKQMTMIPMECSAPSPNTSCNASLYVPSRGLSPSAVASLYSTDAALIRTISRQPTNETIFLVQVSCQCEDSGTNTTAYFHNTQYSVQQGDTPNELTTVVFSGLAWNVSGALQVGEVLKIHLLCGCYQGNSQVQVVSYMVQDGDTLSSVASLLSADMEEIMKMNELLLKNPDIMLPGWVLFVPMGTATAPPKGKHRLVWPAFKIVSSYFRTPK